MEVAGSLTGLAALRGARQETALEPDGDFLAVSHGPRGTAGELAECFRQASQRFVYSAAPPGIHRGFLIGLHGIGVSPCVLEVGCDHTPVWFDDGRRVDERVGRARVQDTA